MSAQSSSGRRRSNNRQYSAEDQALNMISKEAEDRLAAKRAARAEAREIRMKEIEKQQKQSEEKQDRIYELTSEHAAAKVRQQLSGSRRGSIESNDSISDSKDVDYKSEIRDLEEKYKSAMMTSAQLDNEKQSLVYQVELLKDQLEEQDEGYTELQREYKEKCREYDFQKRDLKSLEHELNILKQQLEIKDRLIEESGFVIVANDKGDPVLKKQSSESRSNNGPLPTGAVLVSSETRDFLEKAGEGTLGTSTTLNDSHTKPPGVDCKTKPLISTSSGLAEQDTAKMDTVDAVEPSSEAIKAQDQNDLGSGKLEENVILENRAGDEIMHDSSDVITNLNVVCEHDLFVKSRVGDGGNGNKLEDYTEIPRLDSSVYQGNVESNDEIVQPALASTCTSGNSSLVWDDPGLPSDNPDVSISNFIQKNISVGSESDEGDEFYDAVSIPTLGKSTTEGFIFTESSVLHECDTKSIVIENVTETESCTDDITLEHVPVVNSQGDNFVTQKSDIIKEVSLSPQEVETILLEQESATTNINVDSEVVSDEVKERITEGFPEFPDDTDHTKTGDEQSGMSSTVKQPTDQLSEREHSQENSNIATKGKEEDLEISNIAANEKEDELEISNIATCEKADDPEISNIAASEKEGDSEISNIATSEKEKELEISNIATTEKEGDPEISNIGTSAKEGDSEISNIATSEKEEELEISNIATSEKEGDPDISDIGTSEKEGELEISNITDSKKEDELEISNIATNEKEGDPDISNIGSSEKEDELEISNITDSKKEDELEISNIATNEKEGDPDISDIGTSEKEGELEISNITDSKKEDELEISNIATNEKEGDPDISNIGSSEKEDELEISNITNSEKEDEQELSNLAANEKEGDREICNIVAKEKEDGPENSYSIANEKEDDLKIFGLAVSEKSVFQASDCVMDNNAVMGGLDVIDADMDHEFNPEADVIVEKSKSENIHTEVLKGEKMIETTVTEVSKDAALDLPKAEEDTVTVVEGISQQTETCSDKNEEESDRLSPLHSKSKLFMRSESTEAGSEASDAVCLEDYDLDDIDDILDIQSDDTQEEGKHVGEELKDPMVPEISEESLSKEEGNSNENLEEAQTEAEGGVEKDGISKAESQISLEPDDLEGALDKKMTDTKKSKSRNKSKKFKFFKNVFK